MPIYEYRCADCGYQNEYLQKVSEPPMSLCPSCGRESFRKLLTAAGFQLKGSGWYATDFRNSGTAAAKAGKAESADKADKVDKADKAAGSSAKDGDAAKPAKPESKSESAPAAS